MNNKIDIGNRIKEIRVSRKETLEEFANQIREKTDRKIKTTKSNVSKWEKGLNVPNDVTLKAIAELGNVDTEFILNGFRDLLGNEMPIGYFALFNHEILNDTFIRQVKRTKGISTKFIFIPVKIFSGSAKYLSIIRITCIKHEDFYDEFFIEDSPHIFEYYQFGNSQLDEYLLNTSYTKINVSIYDYISDKSKVKENFAKDFISELTTSILNLDLPIKNDPYIAFINQFNKIINYNLR